MWLNELPVGGASQFAQWCVFDLAKQHGVTVLLDGQGSDELLGGYETYFRLYVQALAETGDLDRLSRERPEIVARYPGVLATPAQSLKERIPYRLRHMLARLSGAGSSILFGMRPDLAALITEANTRERVDGFHALSSALVEDSFGRFLTTLLRYGDRNSMAHSREVRLPFCDHRIPDLALSLPPHLLMGEAQNKRLLREAMRGVLPESIRTRWRKQGFNPPTDLWLSSPRMLTLARETFSSDSFRASPFWIAPVWERLLSRIEKGERGLGWTLWQPLMFEFWRKYFLEALPTSAHTAEACRMRAYSEQ
ncbi:Asparagine synthase (Glutamine-hydrolyzing) [Methylocystis sp. SC2]|nr:Asparagine synthase (Glutamine-hydrolyzing) [Methylocystis sp. SC2]